MWTRPPTKEEIDTDPDKGHVRTKERDRGAWEPPAWTSTWNPTWQQTPPEMNMTTDVWGGKLGGYVAAMTTCKGQGKWETFLRGMLDMPHHRTQGSGLPNHGQGTTRQLFQLWFPRAQQEELPLHGEIT